MSASNLTPVAPGEAASDAPVPEPPVEDSGASVDRVTLLEQETASLKDQLLRHRADFANYRRRVEREQRAAGEAEVAALLSEILPCFDALEKALAAQASADGVREGVEITLKDLSAALGLRGIRAEDPTGQRFDPLRHQALSYEPVPGAQDGAIVTCYRKGYAIGDRLIRPALVKVAQAAPEETAAGIEPASRQEA